MPTKSPADLQDRRQVRAPDRHPGEDDRPVHLHAGLPGARACCTRRVVRPPALRAELRSVDESSVRGHPRRGARWCAKATSSASSRRPSGAPIAPRGRWRRGGRIGKGCRSRARLWEHVRDTRVTRTTLPATSATRRGDERARARRLSATYDFAIHTHGSSGPSCAVAEIRDGKLTCWTASQMTHNLRKQLAAMMRMPEGQVRCIYLEGSGCYGRNGHEDAAGDAALLARGGRPAGAGAVDARGRARLGPERPADPDRPARRHRRAGQRRRLGVGVLHPGGRRRGDVALVPAELAGLPHETQLAPGNIIQNSAHALRRAERRGRSATGWPTRCSSRPGYARRGGCRTPTRTRPSGRAGGGGRGRPARLPPAPPEGRARQRSCCERLALLAKWEQRAPRRSGARGAATSRAGAASPTSSTS